ncbi:hypothetical protein Tco_0057789 [Tanacetum coccineum]
MWRSIMKVPYGRPMIPDLDDTQVQILEPLSKMTESNKKQYIDDVNVMNYLLQTIPNDIYNSVDACKNAKEMWERIKRLIFGSDVTNHVRHPRLMDEFDKFAAKEGESLESAYERLTTLMNIMDRDTVSYDQWYVSLVEFEPRVQASKAKRAARNHDLLALITHSNASSSQYHTRYGGNVKRNVGRQNRNQAFNAGDGNYESNQIVQRASRTESNQGQIEQMLLAMKDKAESNLNDEENDFMLDNSFGDEILEELTSAVIMMARIQPADDNGMNKPNNDAKDDSEVNASHKVIPRGVHEYKNHRKRKIVIIFDYPYVENNGGLDEHDSIAHAQYHDVKILAYNALREAKNQKQLNNELTKHKELLQKELETYIVDLEEKLNSFDGIINKMGQSIQTIHMLGKALNKFYDPFLKVVLGYKNPERLKKAIAVQPKMYHGEMLYSTKLNINSPDSEETLEDAEDNRLRMRNKMVQLDYVKLNALYETFVPQSEPSVKQTYFLIPSTPNECSESNEVMSGLPIQKMPKESKLLKMFKKMALAINDLRDRIDVTLLEDRKRRWMSDNQNSLREFYKTDVIPMSVSLSKTLKELQQELIE